MDLTDTTGGDPVVDLPGVDQIALVVESLRDGMDRFGAILGVGPWTVYRHEPPDLTEATYRGEESTFGMRLAIAELDDTMVELVEPTIGPNIFRDHLDEHGEGLHHVGCFSWDEAETYAVVEAFEEAGMAPVQSGRYLGTEYWYFDTAAQLNGLVLETAIRRNVDQRDPEMIYPEGHQEA